MLARSFQGKLLGLLVGVLLLLQTTTLIAVHFAGRRTLGQSVAEELRLGARVFDRIVSARGRQLSDTVRVLASDFAFREAIASDDQPTIASVLANHGARIDADAALLIALDGSVKADTLGARPGSRPFLPGLVDQARSGKEASGIASFDGRPYQFVVVPVRAPQPIALVCMGFSIGDALLDEAQRLTGLDVSIWSTMEGRKPFIISTLPSAKQNELLESAGLRSPVAAGVEKAVELGGATYETVLQPLATVDDSHISMVLLRSMEEAQRPFRRLELQIFMLSTVALVAALVAAILFARGVSRPLRRLAEGADRIGRGDYAGAVEVARDDEIGSLATAFNQMRTGIRDREDQIKFQATHDALTGLPNRTLFLDRLSHAIASARRRGRLVGMVIMDLDRFKEINDTLGHHFGDDLLVEIGRRMTQTIRESDTIARLGGDEFAVMFETEEVSRAVEVAHRIGRLLETPFTLGSVSVEVAASIGIALYPVHAEDAGTLMRRADVAMYDAKKNHNRFTVYEPGRDEYSLRRLAILSELRQAIASDALEVHYQPIIDVATENAAHAEALVRWRHPTHGLMPPDEFIPLAEQSGTISAITKWVLRRAIRDCAGWNHEGLDLTLAVNLSALDLYDAELPTFISGLLHEGGIPSSRLILEITESAIMRDAAHALKILTDLEARGVSLAIDDFGTGYSSLAHLKRLPVDELKIDKSFVLNLSEGSAEDGVIVRSTIELGHNMGLRVVAEGVENAEAWQELKKFGCDKAQGYFLSRPLPAADFRAWMNEPRWADGRAVCPCSG